MSKNLSNNLNNKIMKENTKKHIKTLSRLSISYILLSYKPAGLKPFILDMDLDD